MEETMVLILLVLVMMVGSYMAGMFPLIVSMSEEKLKKVTVFGAGLLVGTALAVIIPEGIRSLFSEHNHAHDHYDHSVVQSHVSSDISVAIERHATPSIDGHSVIGISLVLGFVFMLLVDQISSSGNENRSPSERNITATIGLVVHAAADGVALGAAATTSHADVEIIVFLAIMLHKAPAAFGLVTFLLHEGIDRQRIRKHLAVFSLSAPLLALITYFGIGQEGKETLSSVNATGIAMLFSAGTFLYVATVHVLPELTQKSTHSHLPSTESNLKGFSGLKNFELLILIVGALTPLLLTMGHHH